METIEKQSFSDVCFKDHTKKWNEPDNEVLQLSVCMCMIFALCLLV